MKRIIALLLVLTTVIITGCSKSNKLLQEQYDTGITELTNCNYEDAVHAFTSAIELDPNYSDIYFHRGDAYISWAQQLFDKGNTDFKQIEGLLNKATADFEKAKEMDASMADSISIKMDQISTLSQLLIPVETEPKHQTFFEEFNINTFCPEYPISGADYFYLEKTGGLYTYGFTFPDESDDYISDKTLLFSIPLTTEKCYGDVSSPLLVEDVTIDIDISFAQVALTEQEEIETLAYYEFVKRDAVAEYGLTEEDLSSRSNKYNAALTEYLNEYSGKRSGYKVTSFVYGFDMGIAAEALKASDDYVDMSWAIIPGIIDKYTGAAFMLPPNQTFSHTLCLNDKNYNIEVITSEWFDYYDSVTGEPITYPDTLDYGINWSGSFTIITPIEYDGLTFFICPSKTEVPINDSVTSMDFSNIDITNCYFFNYEDIKKYEDIKRHEDITGVNP